MKTDQPQNTGEAKSSNPLIKIFVTILTVIVGTVIAFLLDYYFTPRGPPGS